MPVVDPTGAGDAYCGGLVAGWLATGDPVVAAACGTISAGETIGAFGAFGDGPPRTLDGRRRALADLLRSLPPADLLGGTPDALAARVVGAATVATGPGSAA